MVYGQQMMILVMYAYNELKDTENDKYVFIAGYFEDIGCDNNIYYGGHVLLLCMGIIIQLIFVDNKSMRIIDASEGYKISPQTLATKK